MGACQADAGFVTSSLMGQLLRGMFDPPVPGLCARSFPGKWVYQGCLPSAMDLAEVESRLSVEMRSMASGSAVVKGG